jgi:hypothetical protein
MVWKEVMECAHHLKGTFSLADFYAAFWLFVFVRIPLLKPFAYLTDRFRTGIFR